MKVGRREEGAAVCESGEEGEKLQQCEVGRRERVQQCEVGRRERVQQCEVGRRERVQQCEVERRGEGVAV